MDHRIVIYGRDGCPFTRKAREAHPDHRYVNIRTDAAGLEEMLKLSRGQRRVPVIATKEGVTVGYGGS